MLDDVDDDGFEEPVEFSGTYVQLANASVTEHDMLKEVKDAGPILAAQLSELSATAPGQVGAAAQTLEASCQTTLQKLLADSGKSLA